MQAFFDPTNTFFSTIPITHQQIILLFTKSNTNHIFNQRHSLTDPYTNKLIPTIHSDGTIEYYKNDKLHRDNDLPAIIHPDGITVEYYQNGRRHRDNDLPAIIHKDNTLVYCQNDRIHRDNDLPAIIHPDGITVEYYQNGRCHRDNDLPAHIYPSGALVYYKNGQPYTPNIE